MWFSSWALLRRVQPFFFNDPATTEIYTLSLHDALPICSTKRCLRRTTNHCENHFQIRRADRKSTRLNSSHLVISYAVFCLKKKTWNYNSDQSGIRTHLEKRINSLFNSIVRTGPFSDFNRNGRRMQSNSTIFFFNDTATTEIYTLSLHDALPI